MKRTSVFGAGLTALALAIGIAGCSSGFSGGSPDSGVSSSESAATDSAMTFGANEAATGDAASGSISGPMLIVTGDATVVVSDPTEATEGFQEVVQDLGGTIDSTWESNTDYDRSSSITVRVPSDKFEELTAHLPEFGKVEFQNTSSVDVGQQYVDLDARVSALEDSLKRLQALADQAETTEELLQAEDMLTSRQADLDSLQQQLQWLDDQVAMSTLSVTFTTEVVHSEDRFSWEHAWELFLQSITAFAYLVLVALPWALFAAVIILIVRWLLSKRRNRPEPGRPAKWVRPLPPSKSEDSATPEEPSEQDEQ